jgi:hypothetical protein
MWLQRKQRISLVCGTTLPDCGSKTLDGLLVTNVKSKAFNLLSSVCRACSFRFLASASTRALRTFAHSGHGGGKVFSPCRNRCIRMQAAAQRDCLMFSTNFVPFCACKIVTIAFHSLEKSKPPTSVALSIAERASRYLA